METKQILNEKEIINKLINILDRYDNSTEIISNQGQPLDGYSALHNFVDLARKAKVTQQAVTPDAQSDTVL